jgi:hypothetical protein
MNKKNILISIGVILLVIFALGMFGEYSYKNQTNKVQTTLNDSNQTKKASENYTKEELAEAVELGKSDKFDTKFYDNYHIGYNYSEKDYIVIITPYLRLALRSANVAKEYKELSDAEIKVFSSEEFNTLDITATAYGDSYDFGKDLKAVIKIDGQILHPIKTKLSDGVQTTASWPDSPKYSSFNTFSFDNFISFKGKQFQFVLIRPDREVVFDIDMNKYK